MIRTGFYGFSTETILIALAAGIAGIIGVLLGIALVVYLIKRQVNKASKNIKPSPKSPFFTNPQTQIEELKNELLDPSKIRDYIYIDPIELKKHHSQISTRKPIFETETISKIAGKEIEGKAEIPMMGVGGGMTSSQAEEKSIEREYEYDDLVYSQCNLLLNHVVGKEGLFLLPLENFNYDPEIKEKFNRHCKELAEECKTPPPSEWMKYAIQQLDTLHSIVDLKRNIKIAERKKEYIVIKGDFERVCSDYTLVTCCGGKPYKMTLQIIIEEKNIVKKERFSECAIGANINQTVFGTIVRLSDENSYVVIKPIAIF